MVPERAANMSGRTVEVPYEDLVEIESYLVKMQVHLEDICSSDVLLTNPSFEGDANNESQDSCRLESLRVLATKQENVKIHNELVLMKLRNMIPRHKGSGEDVTSNLNLKRSRPLSPLHVPRLPNITGPLDSKLGILALDNGGDSHGTNGTTFEVASPTGGDALPVPLKYIRTGDNTKAPFQKPSTIYVPTAKLGVPILDASNLPTSADASPLTTAGMIGKPPCGSPKKRASRSRRDRNRTKNKVVIAPEPVMQKLMPGDTNKIPEDGYLWRKYGNKPIKTASFKRGYYKCRHFKEVKCLATKIVQQTNNDPSTFSVCYRGDHTCKQQGNMTGIASGRPPSGGEDANVSLADQVNENRELSDPKSPGEVEKDDLLDGMEWPSRDDSSDSASDDLFPSDNGEEAVESSRTPLETPTSPLLDFEMPAIVSMPVDSVPTEETALESTLPWDQPLTTPGGEFKVKFQPIETCPSEGQEVDNGLMLDDNDQLLKMINGGLWEHTDINYWYQDEALSYSHNDELHF